MIVCIFIFTLFIRALKFCGVIYMRGFSNLKYSFIVKNTSNQKFASGFKKNHSSFSIFHSGFLLKILSNAAEKLVLV